MKMLVVAASLAAATLVGAAQARADVNARISVWSEAGEIVAGPGPSTISEQRSDDGAGGVAQAAYGWPLLPFPSPGATLCPSTGCADRSGGATASVDEAAGVLRAGAGASLLVGNPPDRNYGGDADVDAASAIADAITLSKPATVWIEGTVHGTVAAANSDQNELADPNAELDVSLDFCCTRGWEGPRPIGGYDQEYSPETNVGTTPIDDTFSVPVDLPAGTTSFQASLSAQTRLLIDGVAGKVLAQNALLDFDGTVQFHVRVPDDVVATSASGLLPIVGGAAAGDVVAPTTTATPDYDGDWSDHPVRVHLAATDLGGSGVASITYRADGAESIAPTTAAGDATDVLVSAEGATTVTYFATDAAGNAEAPQTLTVEVDTTAPEATATPEPGPNAAGWNNTRVVVTLHATDTRSGVASLAWSSAGAASHLDGTVQGDTATVEVATTVDEGITTITYRATDRAGNVGPPRTVTVRLDFTPPVLTVPAHEVEVDGTIVDKHAVPTAIDYTVEADDNLDPDPVVRCDPPSGSLFPVGNSIVWCTATDAAGNTSTAFFPAAVRDVDNQVAYYVGRFTNDAHAYQLVEMAATSAKRGDFRTACHLLAAYVRTLGGQVQSHALTEAEAEQVRAGWAHMSGVLGC